MRDEVIYVYRSLWFIGMVDMVREYEGQRRSLTWLAVYWLAMERVLRAM